MCFSVKCDKGLKKSNIENVSRACASPRPVLKGCCSKRKTNQSPFEDVLGDVGRLWGIPLNWVGVGLVPRFCYDHLDRTVAT